MLLFIFRKKIFKKDEIVFGTYVESSRGDCVTVTGACDSDGTQTIIEECIPNPTTNYGCLDDNGDQTFKARITTARCELSCRTSSFVVSESEMCNRIDAITGLIDDSEKVCLIEKNIIGYKEKTYTCDHIDDTGVNNCLYTCGVDDVIRFDSGVIKINEDNYANLYPKTILGDSEFIYCFNENGLDQLAPLKLKSVCTVDTCDDFDPSLQKMVSNSNFIFPNKCYDDYGNLIFDMEPFLSPYILSRDGTTKVSACFNDRNLPLPKGTSIYLQPGQKLIANVKCDIELENCDSWGIKVDMTDFNGCNDHVTDIDRYQPCMQNNVAPTLSSDCSVQNKNVFNLFTFGYRTVDMTCVEELSKDYEPGEGLSTNCQIPVSANLWNSATLYHKNDEIYSLMFKTKYYVARTDNVNVNPLSDGNYLIWEPTSNISSNEWDTTTNYNINDNVFVIYFTFVYYKALKDNNNKSPNLTEFWKHIPYTENPVNINAVVYDPTSNYLQNTIVIYNNEYYISKIRNKNILPTNTNYWTIIDKSNFFRPKENKYLVLKSALDVFSTANPKNYSMVLTTDTSVKCLKECIYFDSNVSIPIGINSYIVPHINNASLFRFKYNTENYVFSLYQTPCKNGDDILDTHYGNCGGSPEDSLYPQIVYPMYVGDGSLSDINNVEGQALDLGYSEECTGYDSFQLTPNRLTTVETSNALLVYMVPQNNPASSGESQKVKILAIFGINYFGWLKCNINFTKPGDPSYGLSESDDYAIMYFQPTKFNPYDDSNTSTILYPSGMYTVNDTDVITDTFEAVVKPSGEIVLSPYSSNTVITTPAGLISPKNHDHAISLSDFITLEKVYSSDIINDITKITEIKKNRLQTCSKFFNVDQYDICVEE